MTTRIARILDRQRDREASTSKATMAYGAFALAVVFAVAMLRAETVAPPIPAAGAYRRHRRL